jgi:hypothetical protein
MSGHRRESDTERIWRIRATIEFLKLIAWITIEVLRGGHGPV